MKIADKIKKIIQGKESREDQRYISIEKFSNERRHEIIELTWPKYR